MNIRETWLYRIWSRFLTWFGDIMVRFSPPIVSFADIENLQEKICLGDVVCRKYDCYLDSYFIPGEFTHSGIYVGNGQMRHMLAEGDQTIDLGDFVKDCDGFILLRPGYTGKLAADKAVQWALDVRAKYDFLFDSIEFQTAYDYKNAGLVFRPTILHKPKDMYLYCHEFTAIALLKGGIMLDIDSSKAILADDFIRCCDVILEV